MATLRFSRRAAADLLAIGSYTLRSWGTEQTIRYLDEMESCCRMLAGRPGLGRACDEIRPGLRRMEHGRHVIFYRHSAGGILVIRILHQQMLSEKHTMG